MFSEKTMIGREIQTGKMKDLLKSNRSEFLAVTGRRRIGKTYLVSARKPTNFRKNSNKNITVQVSQINQVVIMLTKNIILALIFGFLRIFSKKVHYSTYVSHCILRFNKNLLF